MEKKMVEEYSNTVYLSYTTLKVVIEELKKLAEKYGDETTVHIDDGGELYVSHFRLETDKELAARIQSEARLKDSRQRQYEALKQEFEGGGA